MRCPLSLDPMVEVAPEVYQCPECGVGPSAKGAGFFWALSEVYTKKSKSYGVAIRFDPALERYTVADIEWDSSGGTPLRYSLEETFLGEIVTTPEMERYALPVISRSGALTLRPLMFPSALGPKEIHQEGSRRRRSSG
jgi:hypothetical protein